MVKAGRTYIDKKRFVLFSEKEDNVAIRNTGFRARRRQQIMGGGRIYLKV